MHQGIMEVLKSRSRDIIEKHERWLESEVKDIVLGNLIENISGKVI